MAAQQQPCERATRTSALTNTQRAHTRRTPRTATAPCSTADGRTRTEKKMALTGVSIPRLSSDSENTMTCQLAQINLICILLSLIDAAQRPICVLLLQRGSGWRSSAAVQCCRVPGSESTRRRTLCRQLCPTSVAHCRPLQQTCRSQPAPTQRRLLSRYSQPLPFICSRTRTGSTEVRTIEGGGGWVRDELPSPDARVCTVRVG